MLLFSIVGNRLSFFLVVAVLALLLCDNVALAVITYDQGTEVVIEGTTDEGVLVTPSSAPTPTTGLLLDDTTVSSGAEPGIQVEGGSKLIDLGGSVSSDTFALFVQDGSSAAICDGAYTGGTTFGLGISAAQIEQSTIEIKTGTFTGGSGTIGNGGIALTIAGPDSTATIIDGMFQGGNSTTGNAGCGLAVAVGANANVHGGRFGTGLGSFPCSLVVADGGTIQVYRGSFVGFWRIIDGGTITVRGSNFFRDFISSPVGGAEYSISPVTATVIAATLCDGTEIVAYLIVEGDADGTLSFVPGCEDPPPIEDCPPRTSKSTKSPTAKSSKTAKSGNGTTGSAKGSKSGKMSSEASSTMRTNDENMFYHANGQADKGSAMIGANAMGTSSSSSYSYSLFGTTSTAAALKITTCLSVLAMMAFYAY